MPNLRNLLMGGPPQVLDDHHGVEGSLLRPPRLDPVDTPTLSCALAPRSAQRTIGAARLERGGVTDEQQPTYVVSAAELLALTFPNAVNTRPVQVPLQPVEQVIEQSIQRAIEAYRKQKGGAMTTRRRFLASLIPDPCSHRSTRGRQGGC